jgi:hypothetical protein
MLTLVDELDRTPREELSPEALSWLEFRDIARGLIGKDPLLLVVPDSDAETDLFVDKAIAFLLECRGDDLPPLDLTGYGERVEPPPAKGKRR